MRLNKIFRDELSEVFGATSVAGAGNFGDYDPALWAQASRAEQKAVQNLYAKAFRRAIRRARTGGRRKVTS